MEKLIGRVEELRRLEQAAHRAEAEGARSILVRGDAGIGKSRLVEAVSEQRSTQGWGTAFGLCVEHDDRPLPFGPVVGLLRGLRQADPGAFDRVASARRDDLAALLPELSDAGSGPAGDVDRLIDAVVDTVRRLADERPLVLTVEDVQWSDPASRDVLASLMIDLGTAPVLLLLTQRTGAVGGDPLATWIGERQRLATVESIELSGFDLDELAEQAAAILGRSPAPEEVRALRDRTGGNVYFAEELLRAERDGHSTLPPSLEAFLAGRVARLDPEARAAAAVIAVAGGRVELGVLAEALGVRPDAASFSSTAFGDLLDRLHRAAVVEFSGRIYRFRHGLLRDVVLPSIPPHEAARLHRALAIARSARLGATPSPRELAELAHHWDEADHGEQALVSLLRAGRAAARTGAHDTAADLLLRVLARWPQVPEASDLTRTDRVEIVVEAVESLALCYRGVEAVHVIEEALAGWAGRLPSGRRALLHAQIAPVQHHLGNPAAADALIARAETLIGEERSADAARVHHRVCKHAVASGRIHATLTAADRAIEIATTHGPHQVLVEASATKALALGVTGRPEEGRRLAATARRLAFADGLVAQVAYTHRVEMLIAVFNDGRTEESFRAAEAGLAFARERCGPRWQADFELDLFLGLVEAGRFDEALAPLESLLAAPIDDLRRLTVLQTAGLRALCLGEIDEAAAWLDDARLLAERYDSAQETGVQARLEAELHRRCGEPSEALASIDRALELQLASDNLAYTRESIVEKVRVLADLVRVDGADACAAVVDQCHALVGGFWGHGAANRAWRALMEFELERCGVPLLTGALDLRSIDRRAEELAAELERCGFAHEAAGVRGEVATDIVAADLPVPVGESLTQRELEVAALVAAGLSNKAIGSRLGVSPRTISTHVSRILRKLGVERRGEVAALYLTAVSRRGAGSRPRSLGFGGPLTMRARTAVEIVSTAIVPSTTTMNPRPAPPQSLNRSAWASLSPIPPAPTRPITAEARMLTSNR